MKITFVGSFDELDLHEFVKASFLIKIIPFTPERIEELKNDTLKFKGFTAKVAFNEDLKPIKIIFRKDKKEKL